MKTVRVVHRGDVKDIRLDRGSATLDGRTLAVAAGPREIVIDGRPTVVEVARAGDRIWVWCEGRVYEFETAKGSRAAAAVDHGHGLEAPMPGRVRRLVAAEGARVCRGDILLVLEAMKMEHSIRAPRDGVLERFHVAEGDLVDAGVDLAELADIPSGAGA